ncbi:calcium-binding protein [Yoonia litorea]|uniref:Type I secretion C-terminal target domain (VC_A0849 subclass) n=1 Tax=Yoonia litorea TaxID=1123755 RepID=A0A1I6MX65_9RHOB|nr:calcium-binding protein [Yoonia litorea]SFS20259.1 type I secretion C-terminal target domain (VC_A0849 subclass) [Yoonia litorea]
MSRIKVVAFAVGDNSHAHSRITDLHVLQDPGSWQVISTTRYDGVLQLWVPDDNTLTVGATMSYRGHLAAGGIGTLTALGDDLIVGGGPDGQLQIVTVNGDNLEAASWLNTLPSDFGSLKTTAVHENAQTVSVYGSLAGLPGIAEIIFSPAGALIGHGLHADPVEPSLATIAAMTVIASEAGAYLLTAHATENPLVLRRIEADGGLSDPQSIGPEDGLWISAASVMESVSVNGRHYVVVGAAGTDSLSVVEVSADGRMLVRDHIIDSRDTRFGGVTALDVIEAGGKTYVIAGGADDGISIFVLLSGGFLVHRASIEDTVDISLANVSAIASHASGDGSVDLFVASSVNPGLTRLHFDGGGAGLTAIGVPQGGNITGTTGFDILQGLEGDDVINAGHGDDILQDGGGSDLLKGGAGADVFILMADNRTDRITDFQPGQDKLDLSHWPLLRDIAQLTISLRETGMEIRYGSEILIVESADGQPIDYRTLSTSDLIGASRLSTILTPGYAGPPRPPVQPDQPDLPYAAFDPGLPFGLLTAGLSSQLRAMMSDPSAATASEVSQLLIGGTGTDMLTGGLRDDVLLGRNGDDTLSGGEGADVLSGGRGNDHLEGAAGDDQLFGGQGADTFIFNAGTDTIADFEVGTDQMILAARLWSGLTSAADVLLFYGETTSDGFQINFDTGDRLVLLGIGEALDLADDIILF